MPQHQRRQPELANVTPDKPLFFFFFKLHHLIQSRHIFKKAGVVFLYVPSLPLSVCCQFDYFLDFFPLSLSSETHTHTPLPVSANAALLCRGGKGRKKRLKREVSTFNKRAQQDEVKADYRAADMLTI